MVEVFEKAISGDTCQTILRKLEEANYVDGGGTVGGLDTSVKHNLQLVPSDSIALEVSRALVQALGQCKALASAIRMNKMTPPRINRYDVDMYYGEHLDNALMRIGNGQMLRTDISMTVCLSDADDYEGGVLRINTDVGPYEFKGGQGDVVIYPGGLLHEVTKVSSGSRIVAVCWIQSLIRDATQRRVIRDLEASISSLDCNASVPREDVLTLRRTMSSLVRLWNDP